MIVRILKNDGTTKEVSGKLYLGIKDMNGKEIYEGDIIKCVSPKDSNIEYWHNGESEEIILTYEKILKAALGEDEIPYDIEENWIVVDNIFNR